MHNDPPLTSLIVIVGAASLIVVTATLLAPGADVLTAIGLGFATSIGGAVVGWLWASRA